VKGELMEIYQIALTNGTVVVVIDYYTEMGWA